MLNRLSHRWTMHFVVHWPDRDNLLLTVRMCFKENFPSCAVMIDCFEIFIDRPSDLLAHAQSWSSYKYQNTPKFLIGITTQGTVSFISRGSGGRVSDKFITEHCGFASVFCLSVKVYFCRPGLFYGIEIS